MSDELGLQCPSVSDFIANVLRVDLVLTFLEVDLVFFFKKKNSFSKTRLESQLY